MTKPFTTAELSDQMDQDMTWRLREFSDMKTAIRGADIISRPTLLRAFIAIMYAHWEGHVRHCATKYFQYIALRKRPYTELKDQFYLNSFIARIDAFFRSKAGVEEKCRFMEQILSSRDRRFSWINPNLIDTKSNLNTDVLRDLCIICGIPFAAFEKEEGFINELLLGRRNKIAHGEEVYLGESELDGFVDRLVNIMRLFRNLLENRIYDQSYLAENGTPRVNGRLRQ
jgi:RiboL-PSP-HEPN